MRMTPQSRSVVSKQFAAKQIFWVRRREARGLRLASIKGVHDSTRRVDAPGPHPTSPWPGVKGNFPVTAGRLCRCNACIRPAIFWEQ